MWLASVTHVTCTNASCHAYEVRHVTHQTNLRTPFVYTSCVLTSDILIMPNVRMSHVTRMNESCHMWVKPLLAPVYMWYLEIPDNAESIYIHILYALRGVYIIHPLSIKKTFHVRRGSWHIRSYIRWDTVHIYCTKFTANLTRHTPIYHNPHNPTHTPQTNLISTIYNTMQRMWRYPRPPTPLSLSPPSTPCCPAPRSCCGLYILYIFMTYIEKERHYTGIHVRICILLRTQYI